MKKINLLYLLAILAIISGLLLYYLPDMTSGHNAESNKTSQTFKEKTIVHDFGTTELKKAPKRIVILDNLYGEILDPLNITPVGATTGRADSQRIFQPSLRNNTRMPKWFQLVGRAIQIWIRLLSKT